MVGDELFYSHPAWFSSIGSHMGQQAQTAWRFIRLFTHADGPPMDNYGYYTMGRGEKSIETDDFSKICGIACVWT